MNNLSTLLGYLILVCNPPAMQHDAYPWLAVGHVLCSTTTSLLSVWVIFRQWRAL